MNKGGPHTFRGGRRPTYLFMFTTYYFVKKIRFLRFFMKKSYFFPTLDYKLEEFLGLVFCCYSHWHCEMLHSVNSFQRDREHHRLADRPTCTTICTTCAQPEGIDHTAILFASF